MKKRLDPSFEERIKHIELIVAYCKLRFGNTLEGQAYCMQMAADYSENPVEVMQEVVEFVVRENK